MQTILAPPIDIGNGSGGAPSPPPPAPRLHGNSVGVKTNAPLERQWSSQAQQTMDNIRDRQ